MTELTKEDLDALEQRLQECIDRTEILSIGLWLGGILRDALTAIRQLRGGREMAEMRCEAVEPKHHVRCALTLGHTACHMGYLPDGDGAAAMWTSEAGRALTPREGHEPIGIDDVVAVQSPIEPCWGQCGIAELKAELTALRQQVERQQDALKDVETYFDKQLSYYQSANEPGFRRQHELWSKVLDALKSGGPTAARGTGE